MKIMNTYIPPGYIVLAIIAIAILTGSLVLSSNEETKDNSPPTLSVISKDFSVYQGDQAQIHINYSDNVNVTEATLFYRLETEDEWQSKSILSQSYTISIDDDETKNYYYFVTIDDSAGNGPVGDPSVDGSQFYTISVLKKSTSDENITIERAVFVEEATATTCSNCPEASQQIHTIYENENIPFYYITHVNDENQKANNRLDNEFNTWAYPTVYIDGGYKVLVGKQNIIDNFESTLQEAANRQAPKIKLTLQAEWNDTREELTNTVYVKNYEKEQYTGTLKVYITEIKSHWTNYDGNPYHFSFLDYGINEPITVEAGENKSVSEIWRATVSGYDVEKQNIWVVAVLFDDVSHEKYSNPGSNENEFDAYYVDATASSRVTEGALPPTIGITTPKPLNRYILGREGKIKLTSLFSTTYILGKLTIQTNVESDLPVDRVIIQITGKRTNISQEFTTAPYEFVWDQFSFGPHTITVTVYDEQGRKNSDSIQVWAFIL